MRDELRPRLLALTGAALLAFALNSILCRAALGAGAIDAGTFTCVRVAAGALTLAVLQAGRGRVGAARVASGSWTSGLALGAYAVAFSLAYGTLHAGVGALVLFGSVQITMLLGGARRGERLGARSAVALALAVTGLAILLVPGATAPPPVGAALMAVAGLAWGIYSLRGRDATDPIASTAGNFARATPISVLLAAVVGTFLSLVRDVQPFELVVVTAPGLVLAAVSGAVTSGLGYVAWYAALPALGAARGAIVQLAVPVLTALLGVAFLSEAPSGRLAVASVLVLGGIALSVARPRR